MSGFEDESRPKKEEKEKDMAPAASGSGDEEGGALRTVAWLLKGLSGNVPGALELSEGRLRFPSEEGLLFDVPLSEVSGVVFPWYYFGGGAKLTAGGRRYRISFVRPNNAREFGAASYDLWLDSLDPQAAAAFRAPLSIYGGRKAGKLWKEVLTTR